MGYYTSVDAEIELKDSVLDRVLSDISKAKSLCEKNPKEATYFDWHLAETEVESFNRDGNAHHLVRPPCEHMKWYGMEEYLDWLNGIALNGVFRWNGEDFDDHGAYKWENGVMFKEVKRWEKME